MRPIPSVSEQTIRSLVGEQSFQRGKQYAREHAIFDERQQDMTLKARCHGSRSEAYSVEATFNAAGKIVNTRCTCPVAGACKHVAALLLTWRGQPQRFLQQGDIAAILERYDRADLVELLKHVLRRYPDVENLLLAYSKQPLAYQPEIYRRQVEAAFRHGTGGGSDEDILADLQDIRALGDRFARMADYAHAVMVYEIVAQGIFDQAPQYRNGYNDFHPTIAECIAGLETCLKAASGEKALRHKVLQVLFAIYRHDIAMGGIGLSDDIPAIILKNATYEEQRTVAQWLRQAIADEEKRDSRFRMQWYGRFLLDLDMHVLDDNAYLRLCRKMGLTYEAVKRLLERGRIDEAADEAATTDSYDLFALVDLFSEQGLEEVAARIMRERAQETADVRVLEWLTDYYGGRKDYRTALEFAERAFHRCSSLEGYRELRRFARKLGCWEDLRQNVLAALRAAHDVVLLLYIALDEKEIDTALFLLRSEKVDDRYDYYGRGPVILSVARAAERPRPQAAIDLYQQYIDHLIAQRSRETYRDACQCLKKVHALYERLGQNKRWLRYLYSLREKNRSLRAFKEELAKAHLL